MIFGQNLYCKKRRGKNNLLWPGINNNNIIYIFFSPQFHSLDLMGQHNILHNLVSIISHTHQRSHQPLHCLHSVHCINSHPNHTYFFFLILIETVPKQFIRNVLLHSLEINPKYLPLKCHGVSKSVLKNITHQVNVLC